MKKEKIKIASLLGMFGNMFLLSIKLVIALISKSQSMLADAINSAGDIFASLLSFVGNKISSVPADDTHHVGHGKAEYIFSMFIGISMCTVSLIVIFNSLKNLLLKTKYDFSIYLIIICLTTILIKVVLYITTKNFYKQTNSILLKSLYIDHRNDILLTSLNLISIIFSLFNIYFTDSIAGIIISIWIIISGSKIIVESYNILMDKSIDEHSIDQIKSIVIQFSPQAEMGKLSSIPIGNKYIIVLTIYVDGQMQTIKAHELTKKIQSKIISKIKKVDRVVIHVNPKM